MSWLNHLLAILALAASCALWVLLQRWIARKAPELPGVGRRCEDCTCGGVEPGQCPNSDPGGDPPLSS